MPVDLDKKYGEQYGCIYLKKTNSKGKEEYVIENNRRVCDKSKKKYLVSNQPYTESDLFFRVKHTEQHPEPTKPGVRDVTYKTFQSTKLGALRFFFSDATPFERAEVFFSTHNKSRPLILGIIAGTSRYYRISELKKIIIFTNILNKSWFGEDKLLANLIAENNKLNNVITYRIDKKSSGDGSYDGVTVSVESHPSFDTYKHTPTKKADNTSDAYVLYKGHQIKLDNRSTFQGKGTKLQTIQKKSYCEVTVYRYKQVSGTQPQNLPIFLVLTEGGNNNKYCLQRINQDGTIWKQIEDPGLDDVITFLIEQRPEYSKSYNDSINVTYQTHHSFNMYEHTPQASHPNKNSYLLYGYQFIERQVNDGYEGSNELKNIQLHKYSKVLVYFFKSETYVYNAEIPIYLELEEKTEHQGGLSSGSPTKYCLQRTDQSGINWKQINKTDLTNSITFLLERKNTGLYNDSVDVEKGIHVSFDVYIHKPTDKTKLCLLLYKFSSLVLNQNKELPDAEILDKLEWKNYESITTYFFVLSNNVTAEIPTYLELKVRDNDSNSSKSYYLQRYTQSPIHWTQTKNPDLSNTITFLLNITENSYNDKSVTVSNEPHSSFKVITQKPGDGYENKKGILRYNDKDLVLVENDHLGKGVEKLKDFNNHTYCSVSLFFYNETGQKQKPTFLELKVKGTGNCPSEGQQECTSSDYKCYLFQIADTEGVTWKQIEYQNLRNTITFRLECKEMHKDGYEKSVTVSKTDQDSFDVYSHTSTDKNKLGLFLYNWDTLTLQPNSELQLSNKLDKLHGNKYCRVDVYYSQTHHNQPPFYLEMFENKGDDNSCQSSDTASSNTYWLQRVDPKGHHWKQITRPELTQQKTQEIFAQIRNDDKNSIMVQLTETSRYDMKLIKNYRTDAVGIPTEQYKSIFPRMNILSGSNYTYYDHDFSDSKYLKESNSIESLRPFIKNIEIKMFNEQQTEQKLEYNPNYESTKAISVFFIKSDNIPLLLFYKDKWYRSTKNDFFRKWNELTGLKGRSPNITDNGGHIKKELNKVYNEFNEILLNETKETGYGIFLPPSGQPQKGFDTTRITVKPEPVPGKFRKITHTTKNNSEIGLIKFRDQELKDESGKNLSEAAKGDQLLKSFTVTTVLAYYHRTDEKYNKPLLLGFMKTGVSRIDVFYQRQSINDNNNWTKIDSITDLRNKDEKIAEKINNIRYNIGKSFLIQVDHQVQGGDSSTYPVQLVENKGGTGSIDVPDKRIAVEKGDCTPPSPQPTGYTCFTHTIPKDLSSTSHYISGLRLYACDKYLETHVSGGSGSLPIYYDSTKNQVKVYFYGNIDTSSDKLDNVPLLAEYSGVYYKPSSRDSYFNSWVTVQVLEEARGDSLEKQGKPLQEVLDGINKDLNTIQLEQTGDNTNYGISKSSVSGTCGNKTNVDQFCNRVTVKREISHKEHYLMVTHKTNNKGPIGPFKYREQTISGIKTSELGNGCNQVHVYYKMGDNEYRQPLLIHITTQGQAPDSGTDCTGKWFHRIGIKLTDWNNADDRDDKYGDNTKIKQELEKIQANLSNYLLLDISQQGKYSGYVQKGSEVSGKKEVGKISSMAALGYDTTRVNNYRHYEHKLSQYYLENKPQINEHLGTQDQNVTLQVSIYIVSKLIDILGTDGQTLSTPLTYGQTEADKGDSNDPYVYFYDTETHSTGSGTDTVPLLFKYGEQYFGPNSKDEYFNKWRQLEIITSNGDLKQNIKNELDNINLRLNEIDLKKKGVPGDSAGYGIEIPYQIKDLIGFNSKRITVKKQEKQGSGAIKYTTVTHSTTNGYNIGNIKELGQCKFDNEHTEQLLKQTHNEAVAIYTSGDTALQTPSLVFICSSTGGLGGTSTVHGYYDLSEGCTSEITFKHVTQTFKLNTIDSTEEQGKSARKILKDSHNELYNKLKSLGLITKTDAEVQVPAALQVPTLQNGHGQGNLLTDQDEGQDDRSNLDLGAGGRGGSGGVGAGTNDLQRSQGPPGKPGPADPAGPPSQNTELGPSQSATQLEQTNHHSTGSSHSTTSINRNGGQPQQDGGGGNGRSGHGGEAGPSEQGSSGSRRGNESTSAQISSGGGDGIGEIIKKPEVYASASGTVGLGVIGTVGTVAF